MTWTKLGDEFADECWTLSDKAFRLHAEGLCWSNRMQTEGQLAKEDMRRWARHPEAADELVDVGWWEDHGGHYQIIHHIGYQRTKKQIAKQSIANAKNANRRWDKKSSKDESSNDSQCDSHSDLQCDMDRTGQAWTRDRGTSLSDGHQNGEASPAEYDLCWDCREVPPVGSVARGNDDPHLCRGCNDIRVEDYLRACEEA